MNLGVLLVCNMKHGPHRVVLETRGLAMNVLVVDVGGTSVKVLATGQKEPGDFRPGRK